MGTPTSRIVNYKRLFPRTTQENGSDEYINEYGSHFRAEARRRRDKMESGLLKY